MPANPLSDSTRIFSLRLEGLGHVPAFKNHKRSILDRNTGKQRTMTDAKTQQWMKRAIQSFESQLRSYAATVAAETSTGCSPPSLTALWPLDDRRQVIVEEIIRSRDVPRGAEGVVLLIEHLTETTK